ncbi:cytochrome ubiquinol oxidase subunit I [Rhizobium leguminosarum]|uniref:cytochrome ubiquinol oxidase subunit I n=1 Tax=Rhizobium leguminosarum TaxID=384 RepID=UPI0032AEDC3C
MIEGHFESHKDGAPLILFGIPNDDAETTHYAAEIPKLGSLILKHELEGEIKGLKEWPRDQRPPALMPFITFRVMAGLDFLMLGIGLWSLWARWKGTLYQSTWLHRAVIAMGPPGFIAVLAGWYTTEVGRQPWTIYRRLRTADSLSPVSAPAVGASLITFIIVYLRSSCSAQHAERRGGISCRAGLQRDTQDGWCKSVSTGRGSSANDARVHASRRLLGRGRD